MTEAQKNEVSRGEGLGYEYVISCFGKGVSAVVTDNYEGGGGLKLPILLLRNM